MSEVTVSLSLDVCSGNAAFQDGDAHSELARILREFADIIEVRRPSEVSAYVRDVNGNKVGDFHLEVLEQDSED